TGLRRDRRPRPRRSSGHNRRGHPGAPVRRQSGTCAVHLRICLSVAARFGHRRCVRLPLAPAHGHAAGGQDQAAVAAARYRCRHPIPSTSRTSAVELATRLDVKYREGFIKNRYIGRTFIMPGQGRRAKSVRQKLNAIDLEFAGKNVLLVDDSIVRGTTSRQIVQMAREAGAHKVYFASAAPPVRYPNVYGINMPGGSELVAHDRDEAEVERIIGADWLIYQDLAGLRQAVAAGNEQLTRFEDSIFTGDYITDDISNE